MIFLILFRRCNEKVRKKPQQRAVGIHTLYLKETNFYFLVFQKLIFFQGSQGKFGKWSNRLDRTEKSAQKICARIFFALLMICVGKRFEDRDFNKQNSTTYVISLLEIRNCITVIFNLRPPRPSLHLQSPANSLLSQYFFIPVISRSAKPNCEDFLAFIYMFHYLNLVILTVRYCYSLFSLFLNF